MRMYGTLEFDRPIDTDRHYISLGGFEFTGNGTKVNFDFWGYEGSVNSENPKLLDFMCRDLDSESFPKSESLPDVLKNLEKIEEFFVYTGEIKEDSEIHPVKLRSLGFTLDDGTDITVAANVLQEANVVDGEC